MNSNNVIDLTNSDADSSDDGCQECAIECRVCGTSAAETAYFVRHDAACGAFVDLCTSCAARGATDAIDCLVCSRCIGHDWLPTPTATLVVDQVEFARAQEVAQVGAKNCNNCDKKCNLLVRHATARCGATTACCVECAADWFGPLCGACGTGLRGAWVAVADLQAASAAFGGTRARRSSRRQVSRTSRDIIGNQVAPTAVVWFEWSQNGETSKKRPNRERQSSKVEQKRQRLETTWGPKSVIQEARAKLRKAEERLAKERRWSAKRGFRRVRKRSWADARKASDEAWRHINKCVAEAARLSTERK